MKNKAESQPQVQPDHDILVNCEPINLTGFITIISDKINTTSEIVDDITNKLGDVSEIFRETMALADKPLKPLPGNSAIHKLSDIAVSLNSLNSKLEFIVNKLDQVI